MTSKEKQSNYDSEISQQELDHFAKLLVDSGVIKERLPTDDAGIDELRQILRKDNICSGLADMPDESMIQFIIALIIKICEKERIEHCMANGIY